MSPRIALHEVDPAAFRALMNFGTYASAGDLPAPLRHLIHIRASQVNGCGYCLIMHLSEARKHGETQARLDLLATWRESDLFTPEERAVLALTEEVTLLANAGVSDQTFAAVRVHFNEEQTVRLLAEIMSINNWNRLNVVLHTPADLKAVRFPAL
ncbi:carboxymuconolactone decarboxylase family protein [Deinococcus aquatilis]|uniref:carboxymuconolactone decarboxylase family protein n=1 Tax=Deinococcus aquatilis TaxID=519440 RepID=UPI000365867C|nr:carboxymuconolactone decarboxylase family protein [Deinococcus aquatilis]